MTRLRLRVSVFSICAIFILLPLQGWSQSWKELSEKAAQAYHAGHYDQALDLTRACIEKASQEFGKGHPHYFGSVGDLATILKKKGQYTEAKRIEEENLALIENALGTVNL